MISWFIFTCHFSSVVPKHIAFPFEARHSRIVYYWSIYYKMVPNVVVDSSATPLLAVDEVEQVQQQRIAGLTGHMFQLTCANMVDELIEEEKLLRQCYSAPESQTTFVSYG